MTPMILNLERLQKAFNAVKDLFRKFGVDRAVVWVILGRSLAIFAGPLTIFMIATRLTAEEQGYYYMFANLLSMAAFFELGLGSWITRFASYEMASLNWLSNGCLFGDPAAYERISSIFRFSVRWYIWAGVLLFALAFPAGCLFFHSQQGSQSISWLVPWLFIVIVTSVSMAISPFFSFLEGCGLVAEMARLTFFRTLTGNIAFWISLLMGVGLFCSPVLGFVSMLWVFGYLIISKRSAFVDLWKASKNQTGRFSWREELLPLQWRTAVTVVAGTLAWQTANPILFKIAGPVSAGRLGMCLSLCSMLQAFGMAWLGTKVPRMGTLFGQGNQAGLDHLFKQSMIQGVVVTSLGALVFFGAVLFLNIMNHPLALRLLAPSDLAILLSSTLIGLIQISLVIYVRVYKQEPFVVQMVVMGIAMPLVCYLSGKLWGTTGMLAGMAAVNLILGLFWTVIIFQTTRARYSMA